MVLSVGGCRFFFLACLVSIGSSFLFRFSFLTIGLIFGDFGVAVTACLDELEAAAGAFLVRRRRVVITLPDPSISPSESTSSDFGSNFSDFSSSSLISLLMRPWPLLSKVLMLSLSVRASRPTRPIR